MRKPLYLAVAFLLLFCSSEVRAQDQAVIATYLETRFLTEKKAETFKALNNPSLLESVKKELEQYRANFTLYSHSGVYGFSREGSLKEDKFEVDTKGMYVDLGSRVRVSPKNIIDKSFLVRDTLDEISWIVGEEHQTLAGRVCYRATGLRLRDSAKCEAWFCPEVPYPLGPDGYTGLPGLIFKLTTHSGKIFTLFGLELSQKLLPIRKPKGKIIDQASYEAERAEVYKSLGIDEEKEKGKKGPRVIQL